MRFGQISFLDILLSQLIERLSLRFGSNVFFGMIESIYNLLKPIPVDIILVGLIVFDGNDLFELVYFGLLLSVILDFGRFYALADGDFATFSEGIPHPLCLGQCCSNDIIGEANPHFFCLASIDIILKEIGIYINLTLCVEIKFTALIEANHYFTPASFFLNLA